MIKTIYLAGGCFWGIQHLFALVPGVTEATAGYANSLTPDPTYREVCTGDTHAAETVKVDYDPDCVSLEQLIGLFLEAVDPTTLNRQGNDVGTQYRSGIYYTDPADAPTVKTLMDKLDRSLGGKLAIEYGPLENFYPAEEYHQDYLDKNPGGYCHVNTSLFKKSPHCWQKLRREPGGPKIRPSRRRDPAPTAHPAPMDGHAERGDRAPICQRV